VSAKSGEVQLTNISDPEFITLSTWSVATAPSKQHFCFLAQVPNDLPNGSGESLINVGVAWILSLKTRREVLQKIRNLYLVVIGRWPAGRRLRKASFLALSTPGLILGSGLLQFEAR